MHVPPPRAGPQVPPLSGCSPSLSTGGDRASPHTPTAWGAEEPRPAGHPTPAPPRPQAPSLGSFLLGSSLTPCSTARKRQTGGPLVRETQIQ